jgi:origin recognition complex subunit 4
MARLNAKIAEQQQQPPQKSPVKPVLVQVSVDVKSSKTTLEQKLRDSFEQEQLERAAKRRPKQVQDSPSTSSYSPVKGQQPPPTVEKRKPGRPRKVIQELQPVPIDAQDENDDAPISPSKVASARKSLHLNATRQPLFTPKKSLGSSPLKPRMLKLDIQPLPTNASAQLTISCTDLKAIQSAVLDQLQSKTHTPFVGLDNEYAKITSLVHQTIVAGESNSMLVIGARGSGKTALVESILHDQAVEHADLFHVVRLNGFMHTDDKIALRDIWRQLGRDMDLEEDAASKNYADTLTTLLALLSHPEELGRSADQMTKSVIFILDEFDLFATHPRQTLLYNLFDIAQSRKAPIAVLGLTTRFDVAEHLEKRVKSRFSHRHVHLSLARDLSTFRHICQNALTPVHTESISEAGMQTWNAILNDLFTLDDFNTHIRNLYYISKSIPAFYTSMLLAICTLPLTSPEIAAPDVLARLSDTTALNYLSPPDAKLATLTSLSSLQLALLISAARLTIIHDTDTVSFALCYAEYVSLASKAKIAASAAGALVHGAGIGRVWSKEVARRAWEGLVSKELVLMEGGKGNTSVRVDVRLEEIGEAEGVDLGAVMARWCREL